MKRFLRFLLVAIATLMFAISVKAQASFFLKINKESISPCATIYGTKSLTAQKNFGFTYFGLVSPTWAEAQFGLYYAPAKWIQLGLNLGLEQGSSKMIRGGASLWLGKGNSSFVALVEKGCGKGNYWYKITLNQKIGRFDFGLRGWRYYGFGPLVQFEIIKNLKFWVMPACGWFESDQNSLIAGLDFKF